MSDVREVPEEVPEDTLHFLMAVWVFFLVMILSMSMVMLLSGRAWAEEAQAMKQASISAAISAQNSVADAVTDKPAQAASPVSGHAMALGLILGIRMAVGPVEEARHVEMASSSQALKIAELRRQQKEEDLKTISMLDADKLKALRWPQ